MVVGRGIEYANASQVTSSLLAINQTGSSNITTVADIVAVVPRPGAFQTSYSGELTSGAFITASGVDLQVNPVGSVVLSGGNGSVIPGRSSMVLGAHGSFTTVNMNNLTNGGNVVIMGNTIGGTFTLPGQRTNTCSIQLGNNFSLPSADNQLNCNANSFRLPNMEGILTSTADVYHVVFNQTTGIMSYTAQPNGSISRILRGVATTGAGGQSIVTPFPGILPPLTNSDVIITLSAKGTTLGGPLVTAALGTVTATTFEILSYQSVNAVAGSPTMVPLANVVVQFTIAY